MKRFFSGVKLLLSTLLLSAPCLAKAQTGAALLQKAEALDRASRFAPAEAAYNQAARAFGKAGNLDGQSKALKELAAMQEHLADVYLQQAQGAAPAAAVAARPPTAARPATATPQPRAVAPAQPAALPRAAAGPVVGAMPLPGRMASGQPHGLFQYLSLFNEHRLYYFTPAGQVYVNPANFSAAGLAAVSPAWRGTFAINGKQMTIKWADGHATTGNYHYDPTGFGCEGSFVCVGPFGSARQLVGTFEGRNAATSVDANSLAVYRTLHLKADGTFTRDNLADAHAETNSGFTTDASGTSRQAGRWSLNGWVLTLADAQGTVRGLAFPTSTDDKTGEAIYFNFNGTIYHNNAK
jgi:hypothetical protein